MRPTVVLVAILGTACVAATDAAESLQTAACRQRAQVSETPPGDAVITAIPGKRQPDGEVVRLFWSDTGDPTDRAHLHVFDCVVDGVRVVRAGPVTADEVVLPLVNGEVNVPIKEIDAPAQP
jgi:hypothetical protein